MHTSRNYRGALCLSKVHSVLQSLDSQGRSIEVSKRFQSDSNRRLASSAAQAPVPQELPTFLSSHPSFPSEAAAISPILARLNTVFPESRTILARVHIHGPFQADLGSTGIAQPVVSAEPLVDRGIARWGSDRASEAAFVKLSTISLPGDTTISREGLSGILSSLFIPNPATTGPLKASCFPVPVHCRSCIAKQ